VERVLHNLLAAVVIMPVPLAISHSLFSNCGLSFCMLYSQSNRSPLFSYLVESNIVFCKLLFISIEKIVKRIRNKMTLNAHIIHGFTVMFYWLVFRSLGDVNAELNIDKHLNLILFVIFSKRLLTSDTNYKSSKFCDSKKFAAKFSFLSHAKYA